MPLTEPRLRARAKQMAENNPAGGAGGEGGWRVTWVVAESDHRDEEADPTRETGPQRRSHSDDCEADEDSRDHVGFNPGDSGGAPAARRTCRVIPHEPLGARRSVGAVAFMRKQ